MPMIYCSQAAFTHRSAAGALLKDPRYYVSFLASHGSQLTHGQRQIWIGQQLNPAAPLYNMAFAFVMATDLRVDIFQRAWSRVLDGSDVLRTSLAERTGAPYRRLLETAGSATEVLDFRSQPDGRAAFSQWSHDRCSRVLPLDRALVDSVLVRLGEGCTGWYLNQHHLITDAWSTVLLFRQVAAEYAALLRDEVAPAELPDYYSTAAALAARTSETPTRAAAMAHWDARRIQDGHAVPFYGHDTTPVGTASTRLTVEIGEARSSAIDQLSLEAGFQSLSTDMSRFAVFATLISSWLHRVSGVPQLVFDAPVAGRPTPTAKRTLGLFIEVFPFGVAVEPQDTFRSLGAKCLEEAQRFLCHALPGTSAPSAATASNVVLNYFPQAFGEFDGAQTSVEWVHPGHGDSVHALRLQVHDFAGSGRYTLHFDFNDEALPVSRRRRALEHFDRVLAAFLGDPDRVIASIDVRTEGEIQALAAFNATDSEPVPDESVLATVLSQVDRTPHDVALRQGPLKVSFRQLREDTEALAATLVQRGVTSGDRIAVLSRRSCHAVIAMLAILRARAAYVPIDPSYPAARIRFLLEDSGATLLLSGEAEYAGAPDGVTCLSIGQGIDIGRGASLTTPLPGLDDLAYLMYTSGSTGRPKGVLIEHRGLADYVAGAARRYVRGTRLSYPLFSSLAFDLTVTSVFLPLVTGGTLEIYPEPLGPVDTALFDVISANRVDFIKLTPSHLSLLRRMDLTGSRIRRMVVGGEELTTALAAAISAQLGDRLEIYNEYGPTEAVVGCVVHRYNRTEDVDSTVPIGAPADHVTVEVLNEALAPVLDGVPGELWISRPGLARGYHGLDTLSTTRFRRSPNPPGTRRYRTGDLVRFTSHGTLEYLGRLDRQLKIAGYRVEPAEVEAVLNAHPGIEQSAVVAQRREDGTPTPAAAPSTCGRCGLSSAYPAVSFDDEGICSICRTYESTKTYAQAYFRTSDELRRLFEESARARKPAYDCMMLLSGGKDSTYALCQLVEMGLSVYAFTLDNGYISDDAKANMRKVTTQLGVPLEFGSTPAMPAIFRDSLTRFSNVCHGCFKTIYTLSTTRAQALGIPVIVTGLSRGQLFETRLDPEMFRGNRYSPDAVDAAVLEARKIYHRVDDEVARSLDVRVFEDDRVFEEIQFVDFYRYCDASLDEMLAYLERTVPWVRPADTGRSTNCLINDVGIYIHNKERGYHNYALPYSWDVRLGHKSRDAALEELDDDPDMDRVRRTLAEIGYDEHRPTVRTDQPTLVAYVVASDDIPEDELRRWLGEHLPSPLVPAILMKVDSIPLTVHGKLDEQALPRPQQSPRSEIHRVPDGPVQQYLAGAWEEQLRVERIGRDHHYFELGGTSLGAMEMMLRVCNEFDIELPLDTVFKHATVKALAEVVEQRILDDVEQLSPHDRGGS